MAQSQTRALRAPVSCCLPSSENTMSFADSQTYSRKSSRLILASFSTALNVPLSSSGCRGTVMNEESLVKVTWLPLCLRTRKPKRLVRILIRSFPETAGSLLNQSLCGDQLSLVYRHLAMLHGVVGHGFEMRLDGLPQVPSGLLLGRPLGCDTQLWDPGNVVLLALVQPDAEFHRHV